MIYATFDNWPLMHSCQRNLPSCYVIMKRQKTHRLLINYCIRYISVSTTFRQCTRISEICHLKLQKMQAESYSAETIEKDGDNDLNAPFSGSVRQFKGAMSFRLYLALCRNNVTECINVKHNCLFALLSGSYSYVHGLCTCILWYTGAAWTQIFSINSLSMVASFLKK